MLAVLTIAIILALPARLIVVLMRGLDVRVVDSGELHLRDRVHRRDHGRLRDRAGALREEHGRHRVDADLVFAGDRS